MPEPTNTSLSDRARAARAMYARKWRKKNPDKVRAANKRYWEKKAAKYLRDDSSPA